MGTINSADIVAYLEKNPESTVEAVAEHIEHDVKAVRNKLSSMKIKGEVDSKVINLRARWSAKTVLGYGVNPNMAYFNSLLAKVRRGVA